MDEVRTSQRRRLVSDTLVWLSGGTLALNLLLIVGLLLLIAANGLGYFWQQPLVLLALEDGGALLGEVHERDLDPQGDARLRLETGNRDVTGRDFVWISQADVREERFPEDAVLLERLEWGNFHGFPAALEKDGQPLAEGREAVWEALGPLVREKRAQREELRDLEEGAIGDVNYAIEGLRLELRGLELADAAGAETERRRAEIEAEMQAEEARYETLLEELTAMRRAYEAEMLVMETADGRRQAMPVGQVVRAVQPNALGSLGKLGLYFSRLGEFLWDEPRESNTEGGIFPAIFGTVMMVFLMALAVVPFGVLAAVYLREYAREGVLVRLVRIAVNNLAGVPSIVFGVFGLGFFVYLIGGSIDELFYPEALPTPTFGTGGILWASLTLALLTVPVVIVATEEGLAAVPRSVRDGSRALGATKFETIWRVVIPSAAPGILTGLILAMARAAGEVAPLMIVGMVKLAPSLPVDGRFPFVHFERKFMHLGFHIYDVGFQSPNVEAVKPLVFATALLLVLVVLATNIAAIVIRNRLRKKYAVSSI